MRIPPALPALLLSLTPWCQLQAEDAVARLKHHPFQEAYLEQAPVSGRVVAGLTVSGYAHAGAPLALVPPPSSAGHSICVQVMSRDGRYWSENTFDMPQRIDTVPVVLEYPSQHNEFLNSLAREDLAVLGSAGECGKTDNGVLFLTSTGDDGSNDSTLSIFVNSARSDTYVAVTNDAAKRRPQRCESIEQGRRTGYDTICTIRLSELDTPSANLDIKIIRRRYERMLPPTLISVQLPRAD